MKKYIITLLVIAIPAMAISQPQSVRKSFRKYAKEEGVVKVTVPGIVLDIASWFVDDQATAKLIRKIDKVKVLAIDNDEYNGEVNLVDDIMKNFKNNAFEQLLTVRSDKEDAVIMIKEGFRNKRELLILAGGDDNAIVYLKGKIVPEMLADLNTEIGLNLESIL